LEEKECSASGKGAEAEREIMSARTIKLGSSAIGLAVAGITVLALVLPGAGALLPREDAWAVIFATDECDDGQVAEGLALHDWLLSHGWMDSHIVFLADHTLADGQATKANIQGALAAVAGVSDGSSTVFISALDYGQWVDGQYYFDATDGQVSGLELAGWIAPINAGEMAIEVSTRYSGALMPYLAGPGRAVATSHAPMEDQSMNNYRLSVGLGSSCADQNDDGYVSFQEAHNYMAQLIQGHFPGTQTPQLLNPGGDLNLNVC
jgi:hypothetical protein